MAGSCRGVSIHFDWDGSYQRATEVSPRRFSSALRRSSKNIRRFSAIVPAQVDLFFILKTWKLSRSGFDCSNSFCSFARASGSSDRRIQRPSESRSTRTGGSSPACVAGFAPSCPADSGSMTGRRAVSFTAEAGSLSCSSRRASWAGTGLVCRADRLGLRGAFDCPSSFLARGSSTPGPSSRRLGSRSRHSACRRRSSVSICSGSADSRTRSAVSAGASASSGSPSSTSSRFTSISSSSLTHSISRFNCPSATTRKRLASSSASRVETRVAAAPPPITRFREPATSWASSLRSGMTFRLRAVPSSFSTRVRMVR